ncbi:MAG: hypothetical protein ACM3MK_06880 [Chitinophagales bacterium]
MEIRIEQELFNWNYKYKVFNNHSLLLTAQANRTILPRFRSVSIMDTSNNETWQLKQEKLLWFIAELIPIINWFLPNGCPYAIYKNGQKVGQITEHYLLKGGTYSANIENQQFKVYSHSGNDYSIFINEKQIGLIKRNAWKTGDGDKYKVLYDKNLKPVLAAIFAIIVDICNYTNDTGIDLVSYETTIWQFGSKEENKKWLPQDDLETL